MEGALMDVVSLTLLSSYNFYHILWMMPNERFVIDYAASKGGLTGMMNLSTRLAEYNISVNDVAPAMIGSTGMISSTMVMDDMVAKIPLRRLGTPEETANAITMLVTTGYMTGQSLLLAGGLR